jgi:hypothetical protein
MTIKVYCGKCPLVHWYEVQSFLLLLCFNFGIFSFYVHLWYSINLHERRKRHKTSQWDHALGDWRACWKQLYSMKWFCISACAGKYKFVKVSNESRCLPQSTVWQPISDPTAQRPEQCWNCQRAFSNFRSLSLPHVTVRRKGSLF